MVCAGCGNRRVEGLMGVVNRLEWLVDGEFELAFAK